jgi:hypothetical protein
MLVARALPAGKIPAAPCHLYFLTAPKDGRHQMSGRDWDKFEKDIADAFERVP